MYKIKYRKIARRDILDIVAYITHNLKNPTAAKRTGEMILAKIETLTSFPHSHQIFYPIKPLKGEYRKLYAGNYLVLYSVDEKERSVFVERIVYKRRNI